MTALDVKPVSTPVKTSLTLDLLDQTSIDGVVAEIGDPVDSVFSCAGLPGPPFTDLQVATVDFIGARQLIEGLLRRCRDGTSISCIASGAGVGWQQELETFSPLLATETFADAVAWCEENAEVAFPFGGYRMSKVVVNQYVAKVCSIYGAQGVRINCLNPGPTATPMMPSFEETNGKETIENTLGVIHRYSQPEEQAWPMVCLNSPPLQLRHRRGAVGRRRVPRDVVDGKSPASRWGNRTGRVRDPHVPVHGPRGFDRALGAIIPTTMRHGPDPSRRDPAGRVTRTTGELVKSTGDGAIAAFRSARSTGCGAAVGRAAGPGRAGLAGRHRAAGCAWASTSATPPSATATGTAPEVNRAARVMAVAHGGQVVCSRVVGRARARRVRSRRPRRAPPPRSAERRCTSSRSRCPGCPRVHPPLRSLDAYRSNLPHELSSFVGREDTTRTIADLVAIAIGSCPSSVSAASGRPGSRCRSAPSCCPSTTDGVWFCELAHGARSRRPARRRRRRGEATRHRRG